MATKQSSKSVVQATDFAELRHPRALALSPDGDLVAYTEWWCDLAKKKYFANLHMLDARTGASYQWTYGEHMDRSPVWSPDGQSLAFCRADKGADGIYVIARTGGEPKLLLRRRGSFDSLKWADGGRSLIIKFRPADPDEEADKAVADGKQADEKAPAVRKIDRLYYRLDGDGFFPRERYQLYRYTPATGKLVQLTKGREDVGGFGISPDGQQLAYIANVQRDPDTRPYHQQLFLLNLRTGKSRALRIGFGEKYSPSFSPDGKQLLYFGHHNIKDAWSVERLHPWLIDLKTGKERNLTPTFDRMAGDHSIGDLGFGLDVPFGIWSADGKSIYYQVSDEGDVYVVRKNLRVGQPEKIWHVKGCVSLWDLAGNKLVLHHLDFNDLGTMHLCEQPRAARPAFRELKRFNTEFASRREFGQAREVHFKSADGTAVHGWVLTPPRFNPRKKYPSILEVHGGPRAQYSRIFFHEMQYLAAQGYVVMFTNPRGSQGYGRDFAGAIIAAWGTKDYEDVMAAADWLEGQPYIDKRRMGITGGSYGGYMTNIVVGRTHRFRAAVSQRSVFDLESFLGTSDIGHLDHYEFGGFPWENPDGYRSQNPLTYVGNIRTPLLIEHQEQDHRCPIEQAEQMYGQLKLRGRTVELHRYPEESHGMSRGGRPDRRVIRLEAIAGWFKKYMK